MLDRLQTFIASGNKNIRLSVATLLYNVSFYLQSTPTASPAIAGRAVEAATTVLRAKSYETEAIIRTLTALGTVLLASPSSKDVAKTLFVVSVVEMSASPHGDKAKSLAKEVYQVLQ